MEVGRKNKQQTKHVEFVPGVPVEVKKADLAPLLTTSSGDTVLGVHVFVADCSEDGMTLDHHATAVLRHELYPEQFPHPDEEAAASDEDEELDDADDVDDVDEELDDEEDDLESEFDGEEETLDDGGEGQDGETLSQEESSAAG